MGQLSESLTCCDFFLYTFSRFAGDTRFGKFFSLFQIFGYVSVLVCQLNVKNGGESRHCFDATWGPRYFVERFRQEVNFVVLWGTMKANRRKERGCGLSCIVR